eukprot:Skav228575  [mRNA]  locus=scaffold1368:152414:152695:+ [translate_table: standard]
MCLFRNSGALGRGDVVAWGVALVDLKRVMVDGSGHTLRPCSGPGAHAEVKIMYTHTDEAPMLATYSLLPVLRAYCRFAGVKIMKKEPWNQEVH